MALTSSASCSLMSQKRSVSSLFAGRVLKKGKRGPPLQEAALRVLQQNQSVEDLLTEVSSNSLNTANNSTQCQIPSAVCASLLMSELKREAELRNVSLTALTVAVLVQKIKELTRDSKDELLPVNTKGVRTRNLPETLKELILEHYRGLCDGKKMYHDAPIQPLIHRKAQLCALLESSCELLSQGALCSKLLWKELSRDEKFPKLEVAFHLHSSNIISLQYILESHGVRVWLVSELKALCSWTPNEAEAKRDQHRVLQLVLQVLVGAGFDQSLEDVPQNKRLSGICCSVLDHMLVWVLETVDQNEAASPDGTGAQTWIELFDTTLCGTLVSPEALQRYFTHCLTKTLTFKPRLTVSSAITLQNEWTFAKTNPLLTNVFCQLTVVFSMQQLFVDLQQILSTHEVNWRHVLSFLSTVLVYNPSAQTSLGELLNVLLNAAFQSYDLESVITAFLLARQGALEGPAVFASYTEWFKKCFGGSSSPHAASKKALVFLLKFLSDLVPFEPPQYLKVHILHPPFVPVKHRSLLLEYVSLAKTRLADLKESLEDMGLYEDVSAAHVEQKHCQEAQDVEKAVSLFENTGRISATVMEASIFRRPYFLTRFLPALLAPRALPVKADARMKFIEALKKADKIPAAQYSSYVASCQKEKQKDTGSDPHDSPVDVLRLQLDVFRELALAEDEGELLAQVSRMSHTLSVLCPPLSHQTTVVHLRTDSPVPDLHAQVVSMILRSFCQCVLDTSRREPPTKCVSWVSRFVMMLTENGQVLSSLLHRLWDLLHNQASSLSAAHVLGLAVLTVQLHSCCSLSPLVELQPAASGPVYVSEALCSAFRLQTHAHMLFCVRFGVVAVSYSLRREDLDLDQLIPISLYKKLLYLIPRLLPRARTIFCSEPKEDVSVPWKSATDDSRSWTKTALSLWSNPAFQSLQLKPQYQLQFEEWLDSELRVCRGEDALSDPERQEYHQWACMELFLPRPEQEGGCGGDVRMLCCRLVSGILENSEVHKGENPKRKESCLPDILSRLQECVYEISLTEHWKGPSHRATVGPCLLELLSQRLSSAIAASPGVGTELILHRTLLSWNRLMLTLPSELFIQITHDAGGSSLDCSLLIEHINQHQRAVCHLANLLPRHTTTHFVKGVLCGSARCGRPSGEFNSAWTQISRHCPLLLVSTVFWWEHMCPILQSLWRRSTDEASLPDQLILLSHSHQWAHRVLCGQSAPTPPAPALLLAACLDRVSQDCEPTNRDYISTLRRELPTPEVLVFLLALCVNRHLSSLLHPEEVSKRPVGTCSALLSELVYSGDWLNVFKSTERGVYQPVAMMLPDELNRLMPWAFYSLMCRQSAEFFHTAVRCPGFIHTAVLRYIDLLQLFIDGHTPAHSSDQVEPSQIVSQSKKLLLRCISQMSDAALSSSQYKQLLELCTWLDPELTAALRHHQNLNLSPEMDFL